MIQEKEEAVSPKNIKRIVALNESEDMLAVEKLKLISFLPDVINVVGLGDLHQTNQETPGSVAIASKGVIYPQLSSNVLNCGMTLIKTNLETGELSEGFLEEFGKRLNCKDFSGAYGLTFKDIEKVMFRGVEPLLERFDLPENVLENIENRGNSFNFNDVPGVLETSEILPRMLLNKRTLGPYLPSFKTNHFLEFQVVTDIPDEETAAKWGIYNGQVVILVHGDYPFTCRLNWHYVPRLRMKDFRLLKRLFYLCSKSYFHFFSKSGLADLSHRFDLYFKKRMFTPIEIESLEGRRYLTSVNMAMNFAYAMRFLLYIYIKDCICSILKSDKEVSLVWDISHDSIQREDRLSNDSWVARKGSAKSVHNKPVIIAGSYNVNSFLGKAADSEEAQEYLYSYDHGCSSITDYLVENKKLADRSGFTTRYKAGSGGRIAKIPHKESTSIEVLVKSLAEKKLVSPVAWLKPIANFKS